MAESEVQKSPCAQRFLRSNANSATQSLCVSSNDVSGKKENEKIIKNEKKTIREYNGSLTPTPTPKKVAISPNRMRRSQSLSAKRGVSGSYSEFEKACLKAHNEFRVKHAVAPLKLNKKLCRFAEEWAKVGYICFLNK